MSKMARDEYLRTSVMPRIVEYTKKASNGCDVWIGALTKGGYPQLSVRGDLLGVAIIHIHRFLLELDVGPLPRGIDAEHACRNRACVRIDPLHVRPLSRLENVRIGLAHSEEVNARRSLALRGLNNADRARLSKFRRDQLKPMKRGSPNEETKARMSQSQRRRFGAV